MLSRVLITHLSLFSGALAMLQEETAARKSHWRRVRQKEAELMESERKLANQIFFNFEHLKMRSVKKQLTAMQEVQFFLAYHWLLLFNSLETVFQILNLKILMVVTFVVETI